MSDTLVETRVDPATQAELQTDVSADLNTDPQPTPVNDLFDKMNVQGKLLTDAGPSQTIDVVPDFRDFTYQLIDHCVKIFQQIDQSQMPMISPPALLAYLLQGVYAYGTVIDVWHVREYTSPFGSDFLNEIRNEQCLNLSLHNCITPIIQDLLHGLMYTFDPRRCNLAFMYSFAAYSFPHDFGRIYPIHMFLELHNLMTQANPTDTEDDVWTRWINYEVIRDENNISLTVGNLIGAAIDNQRVEHYMSRKCRELLAPMTTTASHMRRKYVQFPVHIYDTLLFSEVNPYNYLTGWFIPAQPSVMNFMNQMRDLCFNTFPGSQTLAGMFGIESGTQIMNHYYREPSLPTYHTRKTSINKDSTTCTLAKYCEILRYQCVQCEPEPTIDLVAPSKQAATATLYLRSNRPGSTEPDTLESFSDRKHRNESLLLYSPYSTGKSSLYFPLACGLVIESAEIDGFHVPQPRIDTSIHDENSHFLNSCIPMAAVPPASLLDGDHIFPMRIREYDDVDETKVCFGLYDMAKHRLPIYPNAVACDTLNYLPGFDMTHGVRSFKYASNKIAFEREAAWTSTEVEADLGNFYCWSSYRWMNRNQLQDDNQALNCYFIMNFRTMYGTTPQIHSAIPIHEILT